MIPCDFIVSTKKVAKLLKINKKLRFGGNLNMYVIVLYVPRDCVLNVVRALTDAGAGEIGRYRACAYHQSAHGQFQPMAGAQPFIGEVGQLTTVEEVRVEMVCNRKWVRPALEAMIAAHPYEQPAYHVLEAKTLADFC